MPDLITTTDAGLYCREGDFYIDPWRPVPRALITHAHGDHARFGSARYLAVDEGRALLQKRLGAAAAIDGIAYGESISLNGVRVSFHPAGHVLGSAQIRLEHRGTVWVVTGDYKLAADRTCRPFEPVRCNVLITESTFGLPIYRWAPQAAVFDELNAWRSTNRAEGRASIVFAYSLGKAQRVLSGVDPALGPIFCHGAIQPLNEIYRAAGVDLPATHYVGTAERGRDWSDALILAPPSARGSTWLRRFGDYAAAFASGWMQVRGARRRRSVERGFVLSDHADWPGLLQAIEASGARRVLPTHGFVGPLVRYLQEHGYEAAPLATLFEGELDETNEPTAENADSPEAVEPRDGGEAAL